jgi:hypothetical protein
MNVRGIAQQKHAASAKLRNDAMVDVIGRKPIDAADDDAKTLDDAAADVVPSQLVGIVRDLIPHDPDESYVTFTLQRECRHEIRFIKRNVKLVIDDGSARLGVGDIEPVRVRAARESDVHQFAHFRARAVATREIRRFAGFLAAVGHSKTRDDAVAAIIEGNELDRSLDFDTELC